MWLAFLYAAIILLIGYWGYCKVYSDEIDEERQRRKFESVILKENGLNVLKYRENSFVSWDYYVEVPNDRIKLNSIFTYKNYFDDINAVKQKNGYYILEIVTIFKHFDGELPGYVIKPNKKDVTWFRSECSDPTSMDWRSQKKILDEFTKQFEK
jgi:hypothetical protein